MKLIVGLGNPGLKYSHTRHNVGFDVIEILAKRHKVRLRGLGRKAITGEFSYNSEQIILVKPMTYMNLSGDAIFDLFRKHNPFPSDMIVIFDDMDLPLGKIRIRPSGSAGGHNGMKSIIHRLGTNEFPRLRIGIGRSDEAIDHVLSHFNRNERKIIEQTLQTSADAIERILADGLDLAMNIYNKNED
jgi:peptidyl-tRNA hydrolase, PTH1 family